MMQSTRVLIGPAKLVSSSESLHRRLRADLKVTEHADEGRVFVEGEEFLLYRIRPADAIRFDSLRIRVRGCDVLVAQAHLARSLRVFAPAGGAVDVSLRDVCRDVMDAEGVQLEIDSSRGCLCAPDDDAVALLCSPSWSIAVDSGRASIRFECIWQRPLTALLQPVPVVPEPDVAEPNLVAAGVPAPATVPTATSSSGPAEASPFQAPAVPASLGPPLPPPSSPAEAQGASAAAPTPAPALARPAPHELTDVYIMHDAENCPVPRTKWPVSGARLWQAVVCEAYAALCGLSPSAAKALDLGRLLSPQWTFVLPSASRFEPSSTVLSDLRSCGGFERVDPGSLSGAVDQEIKLRLGELVNVHCDPRRGRPHPRTVGVVLISGDRDFMPEVRRLQQHGFQVGIIHCGGATVSAGVTSVAKLLGPGCNRPVWYDLIASATNNPKRSSGVASEMPLLSAAPAARNTSSASSSARGTTEKPTQPQAPSFSAPASQIVPPQAIASARPREPLAARPALSTVTPAPPRVIPPRLLAPAQRFPAGPRGQPMLRLEGHPSTVAGSALPTGMPIASAHAAYPPADRAPEWAAGADDWARRVLGLCHPAERPGASAEVAALIRAYASNSAITSVDWSRVPLPPTLQARLGALAVPPDVYFPRQEHYFSAPPRPQWPFAGGAEGMSTLPGPLSAPASLLGLAHQLGPAQMPFPPQLQPVHHGPLNPDQSWLAAAHGFYVQNPLMQPVAPPFPPPPQVFPSASAPPWPRAGPQGPFPQPLISHGNIPPGLAERLRRKLLRQQQAASGPNQQADVLTAPVSGVAAGALGSGGFAASVSARASAHMTQEANMPPARVVAPSSALASGAGALNRRTDAAVPDSGNHKAVKSRLPAASMKAASVALPPNFVILRAKNMMKTSSTGTLRAICARDPGFVAVAKQDGRRAFAVYASRQDATRSSLRHGSLFRKKTVSVDFAPRNEAVARQVISCMYGDDRAKSQHVPAGVLPPPMADSEPCGEASAVGDGEDRRRSRKRRREVEAAPDPALVADSEADDDAAVQQCDLPANFALLHISGLPTSFSANRVREICAQQPGFVASCLVHVEGAHERTARAVYSPEPLGHAACRRLAFVAGATVSVITEESLEGIPRQRALRLKAAAARVLSVMARDLTRAKRLSAAAPPSEEVEVDSGEGVGPAAYQEEVAEEDEQEQEEEAQEDEYEQEVDEQDPSRRAEEQDEALVASQAEEDDEGIDREGDEGDEQDVEEDYDQWESGEERDADEDEAGGDGEEEDDAQAYSGDEVAACFDEAVSPGGSSGGSALETGGVGREECTPGIHSDDGSAAPSAAAAGDALIDDDSGYLPSDLADEGVFAEAEGFGEGGVPDCDMPLAFAGGEAPKGTPEDDGASEGGGDAGSSAWKVPVWEVDEELPS